MDRLDGWMDSWLDRLAGWTDGQLYVQAGWLSVLCVPFGAGLSVPKILRLFPSTYNELVSHSMGGRGS